MVPGSRRLKSKLEPAMLGFLFVLLVLSLSTSTYIHNRECIQSFQRFAYHGPRNRMMAAEILPLKPWQFEAEIPSYLLEDYHQLQVKLIRSVEEQPEVWISKETTDKPAFITYHPETGEWEEISPYVEGADLYVQELFLTSDGTLWGSTRATISPTDQIPVLVKFNDDTREFKSDQNAIGIPTSDGQSTLSFPHILLDEQDTFWILINDGGLYSYSPATQQTEKKVDFPDDFVVVAAALAPNGSIYLERQKEWPNRRLSEDTLFQLIPATGELTPLEPPAEAWPVFSGMIVDYTGRLWLGSIGYRELSGDWHLMPDNFEEYSKNIDVGDPFWAAPGIILESSNGFLWYQKYFDAGPWAEGTAWYDPGSEQGCLFTNLPVAIVEDSEQQLWLVANGKLFRLPLT